MIRAKIKAIAKIKDKFYIYIYSNFVLFGKTCVNVNEKSCCWYLFVCETENDARFV